MFDGKFYGTPKVYFARHISGLGWGPLAQEMGINDEPLQIGFDEPSETSFDGNNLARVTALNGRP